MRFHPTLQNDCGTDFINKRLILPCLFLHTSGQDRLLGEHRSKPFVKILHRNVGQCLLQSGNKRFDILHVLGTLSGDGFREPDHNPLHRFLLNIIKYKFEQLGRLHGSQSVGDNLQRVRNSQSGSASVRNLWLRLFPYLIIYAPGARASNLYL